MMKEIILNCIVRFNLYDEIGEFSEYEDFIVAMGNYNEDDRVVIYINSPGGRTDVGASLINTIRNCKAHVTCVVEEPSYSMAAIIALTGDDLVMYPNTYLMFHNYSTYTSGKGQELTQYTNNLNRHYNITMQRYCMPFLSKSEITKILEDGDVYVYADDVYNKTSLDKRIGRHFK